VKEGRKRFRRKEGRNAPQQVAATGDENVAGIVLRKAGFLTPIFFEVLWLQ